jgi:regulator of sigma E protease
VEQRSQSYIGQPVKNRIMVALAGPVANLLSAVILFAGFSFFLGRNIFPPMISEVSPNSPAAHAGIQVDDLVVAIDGKKITDFFQLQSLVVANQGAPMHFLIKRNDNLQEILVTPEEQIIEDEFTKEKTVRPIIGIRTILDPKAANHSVNFFEAVGDGFLNTWEHITLTYQFLGKLVSGQTKNIAGPIGIAQISYQVAEKAGGYWYIGLLKLVAVLSVSIAILNLLPIPLLDGGHILFYIIEALRGAPLSVRVQELGWRIGMTIVGVLFLTATWHDFVRLGIHKYIPFLG